MTKKPKRKGRTGAPPRDGGAGTDARAEAPQPTVMGGMHAAGAAMADAVMAGDGEAAALVLLGIVMLTGTLGTAWTEALGIREGPSGCSPREGGGAGTADGGATTD